MNTVASLPAKLTDLVRRLRDGDWNMRTPEELAECVADAIMEAIATAEQPGSAVQGEAALRGKYGDVLRPFVVAMEAELHANAGKGDRPGWLAMSPQTALLEIYYHLGKLQRAVKKEGGDLIREYAADVANMSMMLLDICGGLALIEDTTAPSAPAAEQAPDPFPWLRELVAEWERAGHDEFAARLQARLDAITGDDIRSAVLARQRDNLRLAREGESQPEARGVEGMVQVPRVKLLELADMLYDNRTTTDSGLPVTVRECIDVAQAAAQELRRYATPNPVRAEQPEGKWKLVPVEPTQAMIEAAERMADDIPLTEWGKVVHPTPAQTYDAMLAAAPAAPVGVDEAMARRLDDYLGGEFDIRIGKQAAHAALVAAIATTEQADG